MRQRHAVRVASWNINCFNAWRTGEKAALLGALDWDVALLQEVGRESFERLAGIDGVVGAEALAFTGGEHHRRPHGAVVLSRVGSLHDLEVLPGLPITERFLAASIDVDGRRVRVASWHAPNGPGDGIEGKMRGYREVAAWATRTFATGSPGSTASSGAPPVILGADTNSWESGWEQGPLDEEDDFAEEHRFMLEPAPHGLRDAFRDVLARDPERLAAILARRPGRSLATTYVRGPSSNPVAERMDRIFVSDAVRVSDVEHHFADAVAVGSDHAVVVAEVSLG
jgi:endonuclease/exonuclease/phosphatase family metal-dependent hydrolase